MEPQLQPADVFLTRGTGLLSRAIRFFTRRFGESRTMVSHVGVVVEGGPIREAIVVEALSRVRRHGLWQRYAPKRRTQVAIYRPINLTPSEMQTIVAEAEAYVGREYGYEMILAHLADWLLQGAYLFRRLIGSDNYPICSWVVAHSFAEVGKTFGVDSGAASPDDVWDFVTSRPDGYAEVRPLVPLMPS